MAISDSIIGVMIESNIHKGKQKLTNKEDLEYGVSITDSCICLQETRNLLLHSYQILSKRKFSEINN